MTERVATYGEYEVWDGDEPHITDGGTIIYPSAELLCAVEAALHLNTTREYAVTSADGKREMAITTDGEGDNTIYIAQIRKTGNDDA